MSIDIIIKQIYRVMLNEDGDKYIDLPVLNFIAKYAVPGSALARKLIIYSYMFDLKGK